jgi:hypothetical protein
MIATTLWRCARSPILSQQLRRRYTLLIDQVARRQTEYGGWEDADGYVSERATALATVTLQRLGDDKHRSNIAEALRFLLEQLIADGTLSARHDDENGDVVATTFGLEALRRSALGDDIPHVLARGEAWLLSAQTDLGAWQSAGWDDDAVTLLVLDYLDQRGAMLPQVDGFLLMARDFFRKAEELRIEGGANDRRLAAIASVHAVEMFLYGLFERREDLGLSVYRDNGVETLGLRDALGELQVALRRLGVLTVSGRLRYRDQLSSLASRRDGIIHRAYEISSNELDAGMQAARRFIEQYGAQLLNLDLLQ